MAFRTQTPIAIYTTCILLVGVQQRSVIHAQSDTSQPSHRREAEIFHARFVKALASGNRNQVAELFQYPMQVRILGLDSRLVAVKDAPTMVNMYPLLFGPRFRCAIERSSQTSGENSTRVTTGILSMAGGSVIAQRTAGTFKIIRLTISLEAPPRTKAPQVVSFPSGKREKQFAGRLAHDETDTFIVSALSRERLEVRIERFPGKALTVRVFNQRTGHVVEGAATEYARVWKARVPEDGQYRVEILRHLPYCDSDVTYLLTVAVR
jgi:hypothetical protein